MDSQRTDDDRSARVDQLLVRTGMKGPFRLVPLEGGANNKVFRVDLPETRLLYKEYFKHPDDPRDRLGHEFAFSTFAWNNGIRALPMPLAQDPVGRCALFEFVPGRKLKAGEVGAAAVQQALYFLQQLQRIRDLPEAELLPPGSEACFTLQEHARTVERRLRRLALVEGIGAVDQAAEEFVRKELTPTCLEFLDGFPRRAEILGLSATAPVPAEDLCLSPSDFGFHNALLRPEGTIKFIDFEYAGWDDPGKTVADFFCQPEVPVPVEHFEHFARTVAYELSEPERHLARFRLLLPLYRLKWCCIMLNDFLPSGNSRRRFARAESDDTERRKRQLEKARSALATLRRERALPWAA